MATQIEITAVKSYVRREAAIKAFEKIFGNTNVRYLVLQGADGRWTPVGVGESAVQAGVHFHFNVIG